nr:hypothetical protein [Stenotrophomonas ginsengisoli]
MHQLPGRYRCRRLAGHQYRHPQPLQTQLLQRRLAVAQDARVGRHGLPDGLIALLELPLRHRLTAQPLGLRYLRRFVQ